uniref:Putative methyltransferase n=1 Tax=viral metagenome TaxID=1070528 RepID=A0A6H1Z9I7_9ZZZZ
MKKYRLLDLFCGAGGAAMGYHRAGFEVVGVDIKPQPHYPFEFHHGDALTFPLDGYDAIHASPPCQGYANVTLWRGNHDNHQRLIGKVRSLLVSWNGPYIIENVRTKELQTNFVLCGTMFGLSIRRHRYFEINWDGLILTNACNHKDERPFEHKQERAYIQAMGIDWMTNHEGREAIPPAYTEWIGKHLIKYLENRKG